ncbi:MAG: hypothetical protein MUP55_01220, partial [Candidatus Aenigmarchaeota archaeon]|nr:hypothetical protein [Candidatus Aenigmarchaeota archaeon]
IYVAFTERAKKSGILNWVTFRDFWLASGRVVFMLLAIAFLLFSIENVFYTAFTIAAVFSILLVLLAK